MDNNENKDLSLFQLFRLYFPKYLRHQCFYGVFFAVVTSMNLLLDLLGFTKEGVTALDILLGYIKAWLIVLVISTAFILLLIYRGKSYYSVLFHKGYCEEYAEAYRSATISEAPIVAVGVRINLSAIYDNIGMPQKADELLEGLDLTILRSKTEKRMYYNNRMAVLLSQYRTQEAYEVYNEAAVFMGETFNAGAEVQKAAVDDTYLELLFQMGKYSEAMQYYEHVIKPKYTKVSYKLAKRFVDSSSPMGDGASSMSIIYTTVACGNIINGYPDIAAEFEHMAIQEIEKKRHYDFAWQKQQCKSRVSERIAKAHEYAEHMKRVSEYGNAANMQQ